MQSVDRLVEERGETAATELTHWEARDRGTNLPKHVGFEIELGNHLAEATGGKSAADAAKAFLQAHHRHRRAGAQTEAPGFSAHEFDGDGFRAYLDHEHAEICSPLVGSATDLVLALRQARSRIARDTQVAQDEVGPLRVSYNNTNRHGVAWAFHGNFLVSRKAFDKWRTAGWAPLRAQWLPFLVTSLPLLGTGKVGAENGAADCPFQFSQRADFMDGEIGLETVSSKTLINTRDEPLADPRRYARLHVIAWDTNLMDFANWLKFGISQILLALLEEEVPLPSLALLDPVHAMHTVSRDLDLRTPLELHDGQHATALAVQRRLASAAARAIEAGCAASHVPDAKQIVRQWLETIDDLETRKARLRRRLDWCAKLQLLQRAQEMGKADPEQLLALDLAYAEVRGVFETLEKAGAVERLEDFAPTHRSTLDPPRLLPREQARALLVRRFGFQLVQVDWDWAAGTDAAGSLWKIPMDNPLEGQDLLRIVTHAVDWPSCLSQLIKLKLAQPVAESAVRGNFHLNDKKGNKANDNNN